MRRRPTISSRAIRRRPTASRRPRRRRATSSARRDAGRPTATDYLGSIDGMLFGESPQNGAIVGRRFIHPEPQVHLHGAAGLYAAELQGRGGRGCGRRRGGALRQRRGAGVRCRSTIISSRAGSPASTSSTVRAGELQRHRDGDRVSRSPTSGISASRSPASTARSIASSSPPRKTASASARAPPKRCRASAPTKASRSGADPQGLARRW